MSRYLNQQLAIKERDLIRESERQPLDHQKKVLHNRKYRELKRLKLETT